MVERMEGRNGRLAEAEPLMDCAFAISCGLPYTIRVLSTYLFLR